MAIRVDGAAENGNGLTILQVASDGTITAPVSADSRSVSSEDMATRLADGSTITAADGKLSAAGGGAATTLLGGWMAFTSAGTGTPQTFEGFAFPFVNATPSEAVTLADVNGGVPVPAGTLRNLRAKSRRFDDGDSSSRSFTATVYVNGVASALTIASAGGDSGINDPVVDDVNEVVVAAGDHVQIVLEAALSDAGGTPTANASVMASVELELD